MEVGDDLGEGPGGHRQANQQDLIEKPFRPQRQEILGRPISLERGKNAFLRSSTSPDVMDNTRGNLQIQFHFEGRNNQEGVQEGEF